METMHRAATPLKDGPGTSRSIRPLLGRDDTNHSWLTGLQSPVLRPFVSYNFDRGSPLFSVLVDRPSLIIHGFY